MNNQSNKNSSLFPQIDTNLAKGVKNFSQRITKSDTALATGLVAGGAGLGTLAFPVLGTLVGAAIGFGIATTASIAKRKNFKNSLLKIIPSVERDPQLRGMADYLQNFLTRINTAFKGLSTNIQTLQQYVEDFDSLTKKNDPKNADLIAKYQESILSYIKGARNEIEAIRNDLTNAIPQFNALIHRILRKRHDKAAHISYIPHSFINQQGYTKLIVKEIKKFTVAQITELCNDKIRVRLSIVQLQAILKRINTLEDTTPEEKTKLNNIFSTQLDEQIKTKVAQIAQCTPAEIQSFTIEELKKVLAIVKLVPQENRTEEEKVRIVTLEQTLEQAEKEESIKPLSAIEDIETWQANTRNIIKSVDAENEMRRPLISGKTDNDYSKQIVTSKSLFDVFTTDAGKQGNKIMDKFSDNIAKYEKKFNGLEKKHDQKVLKQAEERKKALLAKQKKEEKAELAKQKKLQKPFLVKGKKDTFTEKERFRKSSVDAPNILS